VTAADVASIMERVRSNLDRLIDALTYLGYLFDAKSQAAAVDWALEVRLSHAIAYARSSSRTKGKDQLDAFEHPALAWVREESIVLPGRFFPHPQAPGLRRVAPDTALEWQRLEQRAGGPLPATLRTWFETIGAVDLRGRQPFLNPNGTLRAFHIAPLRECVDAFVDGWLPLSPGDPASWKVRLPDAAVDATLADGRSFLDAVGDAFQWAGVPGLAAAPVKPERELEYVRSRLEAL
jgi:hypothetical protein